MNIYCIKDEKIGFRSIMEQNSDGEAIRTFWTTINDTNTLIGQWPEDFSLWRIGRYDKNTGVITPQEGGPEKLMQGTREIKKDGIL